MPADNRGVYSQRWEIRMEGRQALGRLPRGQDLAWAVSGRTWVRERLTTTPGRLAVISVVLVLAAALFGVVATVAESSRAQAASAARTQTEPLLGQAATLYTALSDANATATTTFLEGGLEPPARRARYVAALRLATDALASLTREGSGSADARAALATISQQMPVYSGLIEAARANNRQGLPIGAAYLRQASELLTGTILPAADRLYAIEANRLAGDYGTGTGTVALVVLIIVAIVVLAVLGGAQVYLARTTRRIINVPMLASTAVLMAVSVWAIDGLIGEQNSLTSARHESDSVEVLSAGSVLLSRAQSDQSLTLVNRGSDEVDPADFAAVMRALSPASGLLGEVSVLAGQTHSTPAADRLGNEFASYRAETTKTNELLSGGRTLDAIREGSSASSISAADRLSADLAAQLRAAQGRFMSDAGDASSSLSGLSIAIPVLTALAAGLALIGLRARLGEYR
jgi:hypothetical protein